MKLYFLIFLNVLLIGCTSNKNDSTKEEKTRDEFRKGKYVRIDHIKIDKVSDAFGGFGLISEITFLNKNCEFEYVGLPMSGSYELDGNKIFIDAGGQIGKLSMELLDSGKLEGTGYINGIFMNEQSQEYLNYKEKIKDLYFAKKTIPLRMLPSNVDGKICDTLYEGSDVKITDIDKDWVFVENQKTWRLGWCKKSYLKKY